MIEENSRLSFKNIADMQIRYDLHDSFISICTPQILTHFIDNFDYNEERDEFMKDLFSSEISNEHITFYELETTDYVRRIKSVWDLWRANQDALKQ